MWLQVEGMDLPAQALIGPRRTRAFTTSLTSLELGLFGLCSGVGDGVGEEFGKEDVLLTVSQFTPSNQCGLFRVKLFRQDYHHPPTSGCSFE